MTRPASLDALIHFYEHLTPERLPELHRLYADQAHFRDPFNDVVGVQGIEAVFRHMYTQVDDPRFCITDTVVQEQAAMLAWTFHFRFKGWRPQVEQVVHGMTHLRLDTDGRVDLHRDYWDAAQELYEKFPLLGPVLRRLRKNLSAG